MSFVHTSYSNQERLKVQSLLRQDIHETKDHLLVEKKGFPIFHGKTFNRLRKDQWLNDEIINFYMLLLQERDTELCRLKGGNDRHRAMFFSSFFFQQLLNPTTMAYDFSAVARWTKYDVFLVKRLYFPLNYNSHWTLFTVDINLRLIRYYDPMSGEANSHANILKRWLLDEA